MRIPLPILAAIALAAPPLLAQPALVCTPGASAGTRACEVYHYHVQLFRPDTKQRAEIFATPQFATQAACERARDARAAANQKVVEFIRVKQPQYEPDRFGPCHCDMTGDRTSPYFLNDLTRVVQIRNAEDIRLRVRERLLDMGLTTDSEVVRALDIDPPITPLLGTPKFVPPPQSAPAQLKTSAEDLKSTRTLDTTKPTVVALDLPLVEIGGGVAAPAAQPSVAEAATAPLPSNGPEPPAQPIEETTVTTEPEPKPAENAPTEEEMLSAQDTAEQFVSYERQRVQSVLRASTAIADENIKSKIFEACMQRNQLLSNLRLLIEGSGMRGRLAAAAREAQSESDRLALMTKLFGDEVKRHWAPQDARDVVFEVEDVVAEAPDRVLRDRSGKYTPQQKRHALYLVLARTQPAEDQRLWLSTVVEEFLR